MTKNIIKTYDTPLCHESLVDKQTVRTVYYQDL